MGCCGSGPTLSPELIGRMLVWSDVASLTQYFDGFRKAGLEVGTLRRPYSNEANSSSKAELSAAPPRRRSVARFW